jgi:beta-carotene ketolase (CrtO type)
MSAEYDSIVIGAGHNGLTCACYLAKAGLKTLLLEQYRSVGGMSITEEVTLPGFKSDIHAYGYQFANLSPVPKELNLKSHGFELIHPTISFSSLFDDGRIISCHSTLEGTLKSISKFSTKDSETWKKMYEGYVAAEPIIINALFSPPPPFAAYIAMLERLPGGLDAYRSSRQSVRSWANENFEAEETKLLFAPWGTHASFAPDDPCGAGEFVAPVGLICQRHGNNVVKGGFGNFTKALASYFVAHGGEVLTNAKVSKIIIKDGKAIGVRLENGKEVSAKRAISSSVDPHQFFLKLIGEENLSPILVKKAKRIELGDSVMCVYLALSDLPEYKSGQDARLSSYVHQVHSTLEYMSKMFSESRVGKLPAEPQMIISNDTMIDPSRAPPGKHSMKILVDPVPYEIKGDALGKINSKSWDEAKEPFADRLIDILAESYIPNIKKAILKRTVYSPVDLERGIISAEHGTILHGAGLPYQLGAMRPIPECSGYKTPIHNLYLCGALGYPGPGVSTAPGRNAAQVILSDLKFDFKRIAAAE